jgi:hypothetical protein
VTISSGVDRLYGRIGFSQQIQNLNTPVDNILSQCEGDLNIYKSQYTQYWLYRNGVRLEKYDGIYELNS